MDTTEWQKYWFDYRKRNISMSFGVLDILWNIPGIWVPRTSILLPKRCPKSCQKRLADGIRVSNNFPTYFESVWNAKMVPRWQPERHENRMIVMTEKRERKWLKNVEFRARGGHSDRTDWSCNLIVDIYREIYIYI